MSLLYLVAIIFFIPYSFANIIYDHNTLSSQTTAKGGTIISTWNGISDDSSIGHPYVTHITTDKLIYSQEGYVIYGEINVVLQNGSIEIFQNNTFSFLNIGERIVCPYQSYLNFSIMPNSSVFFYGGPLNLSLTNPYYSPPNTDFFHDIYFNKYSNVDFKAPDIHINNGSNDAINFAWNSTWYKAPWLLILTKTHNGWVWWHQHPYGVLYIPLSGCSILYCYTDDDEDCYETTDGMLRYESPGIVYREIITIKKGFDECVFGVTDFYINNILGQPIFYSGPIKLSSAITHPLRSYFHI
tara:strand:- start:311 stop:1204 length:894 start_codon:yes stop_codon:yes gene_type:complete